MLDAWHPYLLALVALCFLTVFALPGQHYPDPSSLSCSRKVRIPGTAVTCGGSISGILAARVCADHFGEVLLVDAEFTKVLNGGLKTRIVQYKSSHFFLYAAITGLRRLFPKVDTLIRDAGGLISDVDMKQHFRGLPLLPPWKQGDVSSRPVIYLLRRRVFEPILQRMLLSTCPNVRVIDGIARQVSIPDDRNLRIQAVMVQETERKTTTLQEPALVVDCSGASRVGLKWFKALGYRVPQSQYNPHMRYMTITFFSNADVVAKLPIPGGYDNSGIIHVYHASAEEHECVSIWMNRYENNIINLLFGGFGTDDIPRQPDEILEAIKLKYMLQWVIETVRILVESCAADKMAMEPVVLPPFTKTDFERPVTL